MKDKIFRHYKGGLYHYICNATLESDPEKSESELVIYKSLKDKKIWARPCYEFFSAVKVKGEMVLRFKEIDTKQPNTSSI